MLSRAAVSYRLDWNWMEDVLSRWLTQMTYGGMPFSLLLCGLFSGCLNVFTTWQPVSLGVSYPRESKEETLLPLT